jgi:hypothetical protein
MKSPHTGRWLLASSVVLALIVSPFALASGEGNPIRGGARNPSANQSKALTSETQIIADNSTYGTRQSNKSNNGGGAIYGCRSGAGGTSAGNEPCIKAKNLSAGEAFELVTDGTLGGTIDTKAGDGSKPFTTNATGVATGLNADRVDSMSAVDIVNAVKATQPYAQVSESGVLAAHRGVTASARTGEGTYTVTFDQDLSNCAITATESQYTDAGAAAAQLGADKKTVTVRTRSGGGADGSNATPPTDRPFHITATCA